MHLKLRHRRSRPRVPVAAKSSQFCSKCLKLSLLYQRDKPCVDGIKLAADVHLFATENCGEIHVVQKKVLIVDDSPSQVRLMQGLLETEGYEGVGLNDPKLIEQTITTEAPNVILLDVVMPERNGFQVCRELKNNTKFNSIPVILVTSKDTPSDRYWGEQQGADGYVTKPFTREELIRAVRRFA
jgi:twitching motility two-component system response regulator PilH